MQKFNLMDVGTLARHTATLKSQRARSDGLVQEIALQCIAQSIVHRNITPGRDLLDALGKGSRKDALVKYLELFGNFSWDRKENNLVFHDAGLKPANLDEQMDKAAKMSWYEAKKEPKIVSVYDAETIISKALDMVKKKLKDADVTVKNVEVFDEVLAAYHSAVSKLALSRAKADPALIEAGEKADAVVAARQASQNDKPSPATEEDVAKLAEHFNGTPHLQTAAG